MPDLRETAQADELTGLPYHIYYGPEHLDLEQDIHHGNQSRVLVHRTFPKIEAEALRASRVHRVPIKFHSGASKIGFHRKYADTDLALGASSPTEKISLAISGVVPRRAYDMSNGEGLLRYLSDEEHQFLADPSRTFVEGTHSKPQKREKYRLVIGHFYAHQALQHLLDSAETATNIEEALVSDEARVREIGGLMYRQSMNVLDDLLQPTLEIYREARLEGMVPGWSSDPRQSVRELLPVDKFGEYLCAVASAVDLKEAA